MALEWVAFNLEAYTGDTSHLTCEEHGAYLLLMLAYYRSEKPLPATDRALSSICKLTIDRWLECKPAIAPFFIHENPPAGTDETIRWRHTRIEAEIVSGHERMERYSKRAKAGGEARQKNRLVSASSTAQEPQKKDTLTLTKDSLSTDQNGLKEPEPEGPPVGLGAAGIVEPAEAPPLSVIDLNFQPPPEVKAECLGWMDASTFHIEVQKFIFDAREKGKLSSDWVASFGIWIERFRAYAKREASKPPRGKPRVELNPDHTPDDKTNWDYYLRTWLRDQSKWSRRTAGPEPGQPGCLVPLKMFEKYGIDPATGQKVKETT